MFVYTVGLKRYTPQNIVIGGAAGALPPVIGWVAVTNETSLLPWLLFTIIFLWTPPHFWSLSLFCSKDYGDAGIPMLPNIKGSHHTKIQIILYSFALTVAAISPTYFGLLGSLYGGVALTLSIIFIGLALTIFRESGQKNEKRLFAYSIFYLFILFAVMVIDKLSFN